MMTLGRKALKAARRVVARPTAGAFDGLVGQEMAGWVSGPAGRVSVRFGEVELPAHADRARPDLASTGVEGVGFGVAIQRVEEALDDLVQAGDENRYALSARNGDKALSGFSAPLSAAELRTLLSVSIAINRLQAQAF